jgi:hypothetical protein
MMRLLHRPFTPSDPSACMPLVTSRCRYGDLFGHLPNVWCSLLRNDALVSAVIEDLDCAQEDRLVAFGVSVFVTDDFLRHAKRPPLFWMGPELIRRTLRNESPILDPRAIRQANSGEGLNIFTWEVDVRPSDNAEFSAISVELMRSFLEFHSGFKIKEVVGQQPFGPVFELSAQAGGWLFQAPSGHYVGSWNVDAVQQAGAPFLMGCTGEIARQHPGTWLGAVFEYTPPRLFLTGSEQRLLRIALGGRTDEETAAALKVSTSAVKKCWQSIYARVSLRLPELLPDDSGAPWSPSRRGTEKKRRLLSYLRVHPEELRPIVTPGRLLPRSRLEKF